MLIGFAIAVAGCLILSRQFTVDASFLDLAPGMFIFGVGLGMSMGTAIIGVIMLVGALTCALKGKKKSDKADEPVETDE